MATKPKAKAGRPTKCTPKLLKALEKILSKELNAIILTDKELLMLLNEELTESERICDATLENWKAGNDREDGKLFLGLMQKALYIQKENLFKKLAKDTPGSWQKWAWIIERKFDSWNIRYKTDVDLGGKKDNPIEVKNVGELPTDEIIKQLHTRLTNG